MVSDEVKATEFNDAREPIAIPCDDRLYTAVDGYFLATIVVRDDGTGQAVARTDNQRPVIVEDPAGDLYRLEGILRGTGSFSGPADIAETAHLHMRVFELDGGATLR